MSPFARVTSLCTSKGDFGEKKINQTLAEVSETSVVFFFSLKLFPFKQVSDRKNTCKAGENLFPESLILLSPITTDIIGTTLDSC